LISAWNSMVAATVATKPCEWRSTAVNVLHTPRTAKLLIGIKMYSGKGFAFVTGMKNKLPLAIQIVTLMFLIWPGSLGAFQEPETNVNSRYTVEKVQLTGVSESRVSSDLQDEMQKLVGEKFDQEAADRIAKRLRTELRNYTIHTKVQRGDTTDHVKIVYEAERYWWKKFDIEQSRLVYESKEAWSGAISANFDIHHNAFTVGYVNSADEYLERNAGLRLGYEHRKVGTDRLRLRMAFEAYDEKWNPATEFALRSASDVPGIYRQRQNFAPAVAVLPWRDLEISAGTSFERVQIQFPLKHTENAYAGTMSAAYRHRFESSSGVRQRFTAEYTLRTATRVLDSDFVYTRHAVEGLYTASWKRHYLSMRGTAGRITGIAPLFERFSLGNSLMLRGWNKFDVAPLGGSRIAYASIEYHYSDFAVYYDTGAVWDRAQSARFRHSVGFGLADKHGAFLLLGVPLRMRHVEPIVTFGIRF
jgi:hypothetical protein